MSTAIRALVAGLALTLLALLAPVVDTLTTGLLTAHLDDVYAGTGVAPPSASALVTYLVVVGLLGIAGWLATLRLVRRDRRGARPLAITLLLAGTVLAATNLAVTEYDRTVLPPWLGLLGLLPSVAGLVAVVALHRRTPAARVV